MCAAPRQPSRSGLSLVELLVVLAILGTLFGLVLSGVQTARASASRIRCAGQLRQIGVAFQAYQSVFNGQFPEAARLPSAAAGQPSISQALGPFVEGPAVFRCPCDDQYFPVEQTSYEYLAEFRGGVRLEELQARGRASDRLWLLHDFDPVHGRAGSPGSRNFLYADGHVSP